MIVIDLHKGHIVVTMYESIYKRISGGSVTVNSSDQISMTSVNDSSINAGRNLSVTVADSITMICRENSMKFETPSTGIEMSAAKPVKVTGGNTIDITSSLQQNQAMNSRLLQTRNWKWSQNRHCKSSARTMQ